MCCKKNSSKNPFYEKVNMLKKGSFVVESFVIVGSFDYDHTLLHNTHTPYKTLEECKR
jgi:hypothetical protein